MKTNAIDWENFSSSLEEWRGHPVTEVLREAMGKVLTQRKAHLQALFWAGRTDLDPDRKALLTVEQWVEDFFEASADDVQQMMESEE